MNPRRGVTLIELLVAGFIAVMVVYLAYDLIQGESAHYTKTRTKVRLQSDGREAIRAIEEDLLNAGFQTGLNGSVSGFTRYYAQYNPCSNLAQADRVAVTDGGAAGSDVLDIRFFGNDKPLSDVNCLATPKHIRYFVQDGKLVREYTEAGTATTTSSTVLDDVVTLQVQLGLDHTATGRPKTDPDDTLWMDGHLGAWQVPSGSLLMAHPANALAAGGYELSATNWQQSVVGSLSPLATKTLQPFSTYEMTAEFAVNTDFRTMYNAAPGSYIRLRIGPGATVLDSVTVSLPPTDALTRIVWRFQTGASSVSGVQPRFDAFLAGPTAGAPKFAVTRFQVERVRNAGQSANSTAYLWQDGDGTAVQAQSTIAVQVWLLAKSARANKEGDQATFAGVGNWMPSTGFHPTDENSYLVYRRIVPVGNYGN